MNTFQSLSEKILQRIETNPAVTRNNTHRDPSGLKARLRLATTIQVDTESVKAWQNRIIIRSRLRKYASN